MKNIVTSKESIGDIDVRSIKIALIYPPYRNQKKIFFSLAYIIEGLRKSGENIEVELFDSPAMGYDVPTLLNKLIAFSPDIIGISIPFTIMLDQGKEIIKRCRELFRSSWIVTGGTHVTLCPEDVYKESDYVVLGEGVTPILKIAEYYRSGKKGYDINGIVYEKDQSMVSVNRSDTEKNNSDKMGSPDWSDVDLNEFFEPIFFGEKGKGFSIFTSKGCPFNCSYCSNQLLWDRRVIYRDLDDVAKELKYIIDKYNVNNFVLEDDVFTIRKERAIEFCDMLERENIRINWIFQTRPNIVPDNNVLLRCKSMGAKVVNIGIESGNNYVLQQNGTTSKDIIENTVDRIHSAGLKVYGGFIIGFPEDNIDTVWDTITFADSLDIESPGFQLMVPYPKTEVRKKALIAGGIITHDYNEYSTYNVVYVPPGLAGYDLKEIRKFAYLYFHTRKQDRMERFLKRFEGAAEYSAVCEKYTNAYKKRDMYNKEYLKSLVYDSTKDNDSLSVSLPI